MTTAPAGWDGILDDGEKIVWQGRPDTSLHFSVGKVFVTVFGIFFAGFALFWMVMASRAGGVFWMFGLIHFAAGLGIIFNGTYWDTLRRRGTWYTLTDRRAFIATNLPFKGKRLQSYPITGETTFDYIAGPLATIHFAREERRGNKGRRYTVPIGFERIEGGDAVYKLFRKVQEGLAA